MQRFKKIHLVYLVLFIACLIGARWFWHAQFAVNPAPDLSQGQLDLRAIDLDTYGTMALDGQWRFYPDQWIGAENVGQANANPTWLQVPGEWPTGDEQAYGYGTYRLTILLPAGWEEAVSLRFQSIYTAAEIEINGKLVAGAGRIAEQPADYQAQTRPLLVTHLPTVDGTVLDLYVRVSNYASPVKAGMIRSVQFGSASQISQYQQMSIGAQLTVIGTALLHSVYLLIIFLMNPSNRSLLLHVVMMLVGGLTVSVGHEGLLYALLDVSFVSEQIWRAVLYMTSTYLIMLMAVQLAGVRWSPLKVAFPTAAIVLYTLYLILAPDSWTLYATDHGHYMFFYYLFLVISAYYFWRMLRSQAVGALFMLFAIVSVISNILWGILYYSGSSQFVYYPIDMLVAIIGLSAHWFKRYLHHSDENARLSTQLLRANHNKDRFLANTSHELRTPLHGMINIAQSMIQRKDEPLSDSGKHDMQLMIMIGRRMAHLLNDLLDVVRLQEKRLQIRRARVEILPVATGVMDMLRFLHDGRDIQLVLQVPKELPAVYADEERLVQILLNLLHNALKYTHSGTITLEAQQERHEVVLRVGDTGVGITPDVQQRVFEPYEQGEGASGGLGLGLNICKELVELHGSSLEVQSQPGKGSVFSFGLAVYDEHKHKKDQPVIQADNEDKCIESAEELGILMDHASSQSAASVQTERLLELAPELGESALRILAVDDDPVNLKVLAQMFAEDSYDIHTVISGDEALKRLHREHWDLIIADVMMPGMSGYELTRKVRERFTLYELPILLLTARGEPDDRYAGFAAGANDYVTKPADGLELKHRAMSLASLKRAVHDRLQMEAAYMQAQIQPHFLFNSLNAIVAFSSVDLDKMHALVHAFTNYLRISFQFLNAGQLVALAHELELVESYLLIEQERFAERLRVKWLVEDCGEVRLPPLSIQPLVENAVRHGLTSRIHGGDLTIRIYRTGDVVRVMVEDNGVGMAPESIAKLLKRKRKPGQGIGLYNTHSRLVRLYGNGLQIKSALGQGTVVSFEVPCD